MTKRQRFEYDYKTGRIYDNESDWHGTKNPLHWVTRLNVFDRRYKELEKELILKEDLIQQLKNDLNTDDHQNFIKYRNKYVAVCEDLAEMNKSYAKLSEENQKLKSELQQLKGVRID